MTSHLAGLDLRVLTILEAVVLLVVAAVIARWVRLALTELANRFAQDRFRVTALIPLLQFLVFGVAVYFVLGILFDLSPLQLAAFAGLIGATIGLGVKDLVADIIGGIVLVLERPFQVGDKVAIGDQYGEVRAIGLRSTRLLTPDDTLAVIPNFMVFDSALRNANTSDPEMTVTLTFTVSPEADLERVIEIVEDATITSPYVFIGPDDPYAVEVEDELHHRTIRVKAAVAELRNECAFKTDVTERVLETFDKEGIGSPAPPAGTED